MVALFHSHVMCDFLELLCQRGLYLSFFLFFIICLFFLSLSSRIVRRSVMVKYHEWELVMEYNAVYLIGGSHFMST